MRPLGAALTPRPVSTAEAEAVSVVRTEVRYLVSEDGQLTEYADVEEMPPEVRRALGLRLGDALDALTAESIPSAAAALAKTGGTASYVLDAEGNVLGADAAQLDSPEVRASLERAYEALGAALGKTPDGTQARRRS